MRAYGNHTDILIDRDREATSHALCADRGLAPQLLARFENGLLYKFIRGRPSKPEDLIKEPVWRGVARRLGEWHACLPIDAVKDDLKAANGAHINGVDSVNGKHIPGVGKRKPTPNVWTVMQKWIGALPQSTESERSRQAYLQKELDKAFADLDTERGLGKSGFVFGHCDLLSGNIIILPDPNARSPTSKGIEAISFIDYEYATPCPAAFDIANHFAEWGGFDCDYNMLPTRSIRTAFLQTYLESYRNHLPASTTKSFDVKQELPKLAEEVDRYRGMPGFYWGIWALIQATISQIDFDYASYAETRLGEYSAWRQCIEGSTKAQDLPLRERRWAEE